MEHDFWHRRWHKNEIGFHQETVNPYLLEYWPKLGAGLGSTVFVPLCGKSLDLAWLRGQGHGVIGIELSRVAIETFFREQRLEATRRPQGSFERWKADGYRLLCGDFFALTRDDLGPVDVVYDRASLIALPPGMRVRYAAHLRNLLPAGLSVLLITVEYPQKEMDGPPFAVQQDEVESLYSDWQPTLVARHDILAEAKRFRDKGVTRMHEAIYLLTSPGSA
ncbi:MAG: thiopurine S-methyltransferase [Gammaproteobacteria bacterium]|nr:MAG: thiopurine S-methyltransferase [Gammaproteobacteria bacterium]